MTSNARNQTITFVSMSRLRTHIPVFVMVVAIMAVISFQGYWLYKNYREAKQALLVKTNILFREAVYQSHFTKLKLDSSVKFRHAVPDIAAMMPAGERRLADSVRRSPSLNSKVIIRTSRPRYPVFHDSIDVQIDSGRVRKFVSSSPSDARTFIEVLETTESIKDTVKISELEARYKSMLAQEGIGLPFTITRLPGIRRNEIVPPELENANEVSIGIINPITFKVNIGSTTGHILRELLPIIAVSFLLVALTVLSFVLLYRNLIRQRKLTQLKNDFISNITHELKTPIATVSVAVEAMKNFNVLDDPQRTHEYLSISANELQRLSLLVDKVLKLSMFEKNEIQFRKEPFDLKHLVVEVMDSMKLQIEKQNAETVTRFTGNNFEIDADRRHIASVIYNLLDNALKYSTVNPKIEVHLIDRSAFIELRVSDNGPGIPHEYRGKVFEQFFRVPSGDRHNIKGYGLGLSYVNHIVQSHQGFIELESEMGKGSTFIVKLPFAEAPVIHYDKNRSIRKIGFRL